MVVSFSSINMERLKDENVELYRLFVVLLFVVIQNNEANKSGKS